MSPYVQIYLLVFLALSVTQIVMLSDSITRDTDQEHREANEDVDFFLRSFKRILPRQLKLGNFSNNSVYNCTLTGVRSGLTRHGDAVLNVTEDRATFDFGLSIKDSTLQCFWKYKMGFIKFDGTVKAFSDIISARARLAMNLTPGAVPVLEEFDVTEIGKITTDLTGLGVLLNGIGEKILERRIKNSKERIMKELEHSVTTKIQEKFNAFK